MPKLVDAVFFVQRPPSVELREGMFHIIYDIGKQAQFELVMSPSNFLKMRKIAGKVVDQFHEGQSNVVGIRAH